MAEAPRRTTQPCVLDDYDPQQLQDLSITDPSRFWALYGQAQQEVLDRIVLPDNLLEWAAKHEDRMGTTHRVRVHGKAGPTPGRGDRYAMLAVFLIGRYGEDPRHWPSRVSAEEVADRLVTWDAGAWPTGIAIEEVGR